MLSDYQDKPKCIITGDETWICAYDPETIEQSTAYRVKGEARPKKSTSKSFKNQAHGDSFFRFSWCVAPRQTVNNEYYLSVMRRLHEAIRLKRPELWANNSWFLHHHNAQFHTVHVLHDHFIFNHRIRLVWLRVTSAYSRNS